MSDAADALEGQEAIDGEHVSANMLDYYQPYIHPNSNNSESFKYMEEHHYLFRSKRDAPQAQGVQPMRLGSFAGHVCYFPYPDRHNILEAMATDMSNSVPMYWNQIAFDECQEGCRLVIDIDSKDRLLTTVDISQLSAMLSTTLKAYYKDEFIDIFVAKCGPRLSKFKPSSALHMIAHVRVSVAQARQLIHAFKLRLNNNVDINMRGLEVDAAVYKVGSDCCNIRMIYCHKIEVCPLCEAHLDKQSSCKLCQHVGRVVAKATYVPIGAVGPSGHLDADYFKSRCSSWSLVAQHYSIWSDVDDVKEGFAKPDGDTLISDIDGKSLDTLDAEGRAAKSKRKIAKAVVEHTNPAYQLIEEFIRKQTCDGKLLWPNITVAEVTLSPKHRGAMINVTGIGCTLCPYAKRDHGNNRIYFTMGTRGMMAVRCHSTKSTECRNQVKFYEFEVPGKICNLIFGREGPPPLVKRRAVSKSNEGDDADGASARPASSASVMDILMSMGTPVNERRRGGPTTKTSVAEKRLAKVRKFYEELKPTA